MRSNADLLDVWIDAKINQRRGTDGATDLSAIHLVRNAVLDDLIEECQGGSAGPYKLMDGWYCEGCVTETFVEEWLRSRKESQ